MIDTDILDNYQVISKVESKTKQFCKKFTRQQILKFTDQYESCVSNENIAEDFWIEVIRDDPEYESLFEFKVQTLAAAMSKQELLHMYTMLNIPLPYDNPTVADLRAEFSKVFYELLYNLRDDIREIAFEEIENTCIEYVMNVLNKYRL